MDILTNLRTWTPDRGDNRSDFDDDVKRPYVTRKVKSMNRIVEGADDLKVNRPAPANPGMIVSADWSPAGTVGVVGPVDLRTDGQVRYMDNLISWITEKDQTAGDAARVWTDNVTAAGKWEAGRDNPSKFSISGWINRLKAKNEELNNAAKLAPKAAPVVEDFGNVPVGYYALNTEDGIKFYRVSRSDAGRTYLRVQASDEFHLIHNLVTKTEIINAILADVRGAHALYGQEIGRCGRCHRTLTDELSRSRGIGPDCWDKI